MRPRRTVLSNFTFVLDGGTEDNDLWCQRTTDPDGYLVISSVWELTDDERQQIAAGANIELLVWGEGHPAVELRTNDTPLGRPPSNG